MEYINHNQIAVIGMISPTGVPHGAALYVYATAADKVYFVTKEDTRKFQYIMQNNAVSLTIVNPNKNSTLQAAGHAEVVENSNDIEMVMGQMTHVYARASDWLPPIAKIKGGAYRVVCLRLDTVRLSRFGGAKPGDEHIYLEF